MLQITLSSWGSGTRQFSRRGAGAQRIQSLLGLELLGRRKQRTKDHYELRQTSECAALFQHNPNPRSHGLRPGGPTDSSTARERWVSSHDQIKPRQGRQNYLPSLASPPTHKLPHLLNLDRKVSCHLAGLFWINQLPLVRECPFQPFVFSTNPLPYDQSLLTQ